MDSADRKTFRSWFITITVVWMLAVLGLVAVTATYSERDSGVTSAETTASIAHAEAQ